MRKYMYCVEIQEVLNKCFSLFLPAPISNVKLYLILKKITGLPWWHSG